MDSDLITLGELIELLESRARRVGRDSKVALSGHEPQRIEIDDNYEPDLYEDAKTVLIT